MYYPVAVINPKAAQICLLCLYNFPPKLQYLKDSNAEIKRKKFSLPGDILNFYLSHHDQSDFLAVL